MFKVYCKDRGNVQWVCTPSHYIIGISHRIPWNHHHAIPWRNLKWQQFQKDISMAISNGPLAMAHSKNCALRLEHRPQCLWKVLSMHVRHLASNRIEVFFGGLAKRRDKYQVQSRLQQIFDPLHFHGCWFPQKLEGNCQKTWSSSHPTPNWKFGKMTSTFWPFHWFGHAWMLGEDWHRDYMD